LIPRLSPLETRVLGVLVEKERTVPDSYPLSLNALALGCNQKNNRDPLMQATDAEVQAAVDALRPLSLVIESSGSRVMRYAHNVGRVLHVPEPAVALLAALMLRGPQTPGELRIATERLHRFADLGEVEAALRELAERSPADGDRSSSSCPDNPARASSAGRTSCRARSKRRRAFRRPRPRRSRQRPTRRLPRSRRSRPRSPGSRRRPPSCARSSSASRATSAHRSRQRTRPARRCERAAFVRSRSQFFTVGHRVAT
jgi:hypothetical protein